MFFKYNYLVFKYLSIENLSLPILSLEKGRFFVLDNDRNMNRMILTLCEQNHYLINISF